MNVISGEKKKHATKRYETHLLFIGNTHFMIS